MHRFGFAALLFVLWPIAASAQENDCGSLDTQIEMTQCSKTEWQTADAALNEAYALARQHMRDIDSGLAAVERGAEAALRDGQRGWISYRDNACAAEGYVYHGGTIEPMIVFDCYARLTWTRAQELGDMVPAE